MATFQAYLVSPSQAFSEYSSEASTPIVERDTTSPDLSTLPEEVAPVSDDAFFDVDELIQSDAFNDFVDDDEKGQIPVYVVDSTFWPSENENQGSNPATFNQYATYGGPQYASNAYNGERQNMQYVSPINPYEQQQPFYSTPSQYASPASSVPSPNYGVFSQSGVEQFSMMPPQHPHQHPHQQPHQQLQQQPQLHSQMGISSPHLMGVIDMIDTYPEGPEAKKRKRAVGEQVVKACIPCSNAKRKCDGGRPCERCIKLKRTDECRDKAQMTRGRKKNAVAKMDSNSAGTPPMDNMQILSTTYQPPSTAPEMTDSMVETQIIPVVASDARSSISTVPAANVAVVSNSVPLHDRVFPQEMQDQGNMSFFALTRIPLQNHINTIDDYQDKRSLELEMEDVTAQFQKLNYPRVKTQVDEKMDFLQKLALTTSPIPATRITFDTELWKPREFFINPAFARMVGLPPGRPTVCFKHDSALLLHPVDIIRQARAFIDAVREGKSSFSFRGRYNTFPQKFIELTEYSHIEYNRAGVPCALTLYYSEGKDPTVPPPPPSSLTVPHPLCPQYLAEQEAAAAAAAAVSQSSMPSVPT